MDIVLIVIGVIALFLGGRVPLIGLMSAPCGAVALLAGIAVHGSRKRIKTLEEQVQALHAAAMSAVDDLQEDVEAQKED